jgi:hypothetical protein
MPKGHVFVERNYPRVSTKIPIRYHEVPNKNEIEKIDEHNTRVKASHSMDVSLGGLCLVSKEPLNVGSFLRLHIYMASESVFISTLARVVWANNAGAGIRFLAMKDEEMMALKEHINKIDHGIKHTEKKGDSI